MVIAKARKIFMKQHCSKYVRLSAGSALLAVVLAFPITSQADWQLVWSDEFDGSTIDSATWTFETGNGSGGWGNNEREYYTARTNNAFVADGLLHIVAQQEAMGGFPYTSARMKTENLFSKKYGRFEFRTKLPVGVGCWPANWMMPQGSVYGGWAASGEIDVMENRGSAPTITGGTIHYGGSWPANTYSGASYVFPNNGVTTDFHNYMLEWGSNYISWYVDGVPYQTQSNWYSAGNPYPAPFDQPFYLVLNLAIGGNYLGNPSDTEIDSGTPFPAEMQLDYIRVYDYVTEPPGPITASIQSGAQLSWPTTAGTTWTLESAAADNLWSNLGGPTAGTGSTNSMFDPLWPAPHVQFQVLEATIGAGNIVANSGFEAGTGLSVSNWSMTGSQLPTRLDTISHGGQYCVSLAVTNPAATPNSSQLEQKVVNQGGMPVAPGQTYGFAFWARQVSSGVSLVQNFRVMWLNNSGGSLGDTGWIGFTGGSGSWKQINVNNLTAPANAVNAQITLYATTGAVLHGYGEVLIDDVSLSYATAGPTNLVAVAVQPAVEVSWPGAGGSLYDVQWTADLVANSWSNLVSSVVGAGGTNSVVDVIDSNQLRFYRVVRLP